MLKKKNSAYAAATKIFAVEGAILGYFMNELYTNKVAELNTLYLLKGIQLLASEVSFRSVATTSP